MTIYYYFITEAMADAGVKMGLPRDLAYQLAAQTMVHNWFWKNFEILISRKKTYFIEFWFSRILFTFFIGWCWSNGFENWKSSGHVERRCLLTWRLYHYSCWPIRTEWNSRLHDEGCWGCGQKMSSTWFLKWKKIFSYISELFVKKYLHILQSPKWEKKDFIVSGSSSIIKFWNKEYSMYLYIS